MKEGNRHFVRVNGIAIGEESKGNSVQSIVRKLDAHTVWRSGGWQGGHHITHDDGREMAFSHFGAGTFDGASTYLKHMVISPVELFTEAAELEQKGVAKPLDLITVDQDCLTTTPFHSAISRFREIMRGPNRKGTIGKGVGEALRDSQNPDFAIRAGEFTDRALVRRKAEAIRQMKLAQAAEIVAAAGGSVSPDTYEELRILQDQELVELTADACRYIANLVKIVDDRYLEALLKRNGSIVNEVSHGALHHPWYGFVPHVTQIDPTSQDVLTTVKSHNYSGQLVHMGIVRTYLTRHGAGPFVSYSPEMTRSLVETHNNASNTANDWLGDFKTGAFDIVNLKYALAFSGGAESFDGLGISYIDVLSSRTEWPVCEAYTYHGSATDLDKYFYRDGNVITGIKVHPNTRDDAHHQHQLRLTQLLNECQPIFKTLRPTQTKNLEQVFLEYVEHSLGVPVITTAYGPKTSDRLFLPGWDRVMNGEK